jgi:hypothetical protein
MGRAKRLLPDRQCALVEFLRLSVLPLVCIHESQVVEAFAHCGVIRTKRCFADRQRALEEPLSLRVLRLRSMDTSQQVQGSGNDGVTRAQGFLTYRQCTVEEPLVCRQSISDSWLGNLRECLAHLV